jgi:hypothetical protein
MTAVSALTMSAAWAIAPRLDPVEHRGRRHP